MTATVSCTPALGHRSSSPSLSMSPALTGSTPLTTVLDPHPTPVSAAWLMAAASDPLRMSTTGRLMEEAARLRTVSATDRAAQTVWDAEGGCEARCPITRPRIPAVTAPVLGVTTAALPVPNPAQGV